MQWQKSLEQNYASFLEYNSLFNTLIYLKHGSI